MKQFKSCAILLLIASLSAFPLFALIVGASGWQKPFRGIQLNRTYPIAKGLIGAWIMNDGSSKKLFDLSGNHNTGTLINAVTWVPEGIHTTYVASGIGTVPLVKCGAGWDKAAYTIATKITVDIMPTYANQYFFSFGEGATTPSLGIGNTGHGDADRYRLRVVYNSGDLINSSSYKIFPGEYLVVVTFVPNDYVNVYVNNTLLWGTTGLAAWNYNGAIDGFTINGHDRTANATDYASFEGTTKTLYMWDRILTESEIRALGRKLYPMFEPPKTAGIFGFASGGAVMMHPIRRFMGDGY